MSRGAFITVLFAALLLAGSASGQAERSMPGVPDLVLTTLDGNEWSLKENRGSIVVLNFWATWCEPYRTEIPFLVKLASEFKHAGVRVAGISVDAGGKMLVSKFATEYKINYPVLIPDRDSPLARVENVPMTLLIDREGRLFRKYTGAVPEKTLRADIEKLVVKANGPSSR